MSYYGYIKKRAKDNYWLTLQFQEMNDYNLDGIYVEESSENTELTNLIKQLKPKDTVIIYSLAILNYEEETMRHFFWKLLELEVTLIIKKDKINTSEQQDARFIEFCLICLETESNRRSCLVNKSNKKNKKHIGRPKIDNVVIRRMIFLREKKNYSLRQIAQECGVSLGTVHKYIKTTLE